MVDTGQRPSPNVVHHRIEQELGTGRHRANSPISDDRLRDRDQGATLLTFEPRRDVAAIERRYGALTGSLGILLHIEGVIDRLGQPAVFNTKLEGLAVVAGSNKKGICISCEG